MAQHDAQPLAMACWDISWLLQRDIRDGAYASLERVLDETERRGFNTLRLDPCPHRMATPETGSHMVRYRFHPQGPREGDVKLRHQRHRRLQSAAGVGFKVWVSSGFIIVSRDRCPIDICPDTCLTGWW